MYNKYLAIRQEIKSLQARKDELETIRAQAGRHFKPEKEAKYEATLNEIDQTILGLQKIIPYWEVQLGSDDQRDNNPPHTVYLSPFEVFDELSEGGPDWYESVQFTATVNNEPEKLIKSLTTETACINYLKTLAPFGAEYKWRPPTEAEEEFMIRRDGEEIFGDLRWLWAIDAYYDEFPAHIRDGIANNVNPVNWVDPEGASGRVYRVIRGRSYGASYRASSTTTFSLTGLGVRLVRNIPRFIREQG